MRSRDRQGAAGGFRALVGFCFLIYIVVTWVCSVENLLSLILNQFCTFVYVCSTLKFCVFLKCNKTNSLGFPGGAVVESLPADAGDTGSCPDPGGSHMPRSGWAREPWPLSLRVRSLCSATREATTARGPRTAKIIIIDNNVAHT